MRFVLGDGMETWGREGHTHARLGVRSSLCRRCDAIDRHKHEMYTRRSSRSCLSLTRLESMATRTCYHKRNRCRVQEELDISNLCGNRATRSSVQDVVRVNNVIEE